MDFVLACHFLYIWRVNLRLGIFIAAHHIEEHKDKVHVSGTSGSYRMWWSRRSGFDIPLAGYIRPADITPACGGNNDNTVILSEETIVDPIYLMSQISKIRDDFDSVKNIRTYLQKRDPTFQSGDAVLYNNDFNHCLAMISPTCGFHYHNIHDKNPKILHELECTITAVACQSEQPKSRERRSSQSKEKEKTTTYFNLSSLNENEQENVFTNENIIGNNSPDVVVDANGSLTNRSYLTRLTIATYLEKQIINQIIIQQKY